MNPADGQSKNTDHTSSPSSEKSVYFDASDYPGMRFFSRTSIADKTPANDQATSSSGNGLVSSQGSERSSGMDQPNRYPEPNVDSPLNEGQTDVGRQASVSNQRPLTQGDRDDNNYKGFRESQTIGEPESSGIPIGREADTSHHRNVSTSSGAPGSDSGYGSPTNQHRRSKSMGTSGKAPAERAEGNTEAAGGDNDDIKPIPILWTDAADGQGQLSRVRSQRTARGEDGGGGYMRRSGSVRSNRSGFAVDRDRGDQESIRTTPSMRRRRIDLSGGSFAGGAGTVGPNSEPEVDDSLSERRVAADAGLSKKQKMRLNKAEVKEGKRVAAVIKLEGKAEQRALEIAIKEMVDIQKMQKASIKEEARTHATHAAALRTYHKEELEFFAARAKYEKAQADLQAFEDSREASRQHAQDATEMLQDKNKEVEWMRAQKATHDHEREAKMLKLSGKA